MRRLRRVEIGSDLGKILATMAWLVIAGVGPVAASQLQVDAVNPVASVATGDSARIVIDIHNTGPGTAYISGITATLDPGFDLGDPFDAFLQLCPPMLSSEETWSGTAMVFLVPSDAPVGNYDFTILLQGGSTAYDSAWVGSVGIRLSIIRAGCLPTFTSVPGPQVVGAGSTVTLGVSVESASGTTYGWRRDGVDLVDDSRTTGTRTASLQIAAVSPSDAGNYDLVVTNDCGDATTAPAELDVNATTAVHPGVEATPLGLSFANPLRDWDRLQWSTPRGGHVRLTLSDVAGRLLGVLVDEQAAAGAHQLPVGSATGFAGSLRNGVYYLRLETPSGTLSRKVVVLSR